MSAAWDLPRIPPPPPPPEPKLCAACKAFKAECTAPVGEGSAALCWLCAHHVVDHDCSLEAAVTHECECLPHEIYPGRVDPRPRVDVLWGGQPVTIIGDERVPEHVMIPVFKRGDVEAILQNPFAKVPRRRPRCSICGEVGHNVQTCTKR